MTKTTATLSGSCTFCGRHLKPRCGLDLLGRAYCRRWRCNLTLAAKRRMLRLAQWIERNSQRVARRLRDASV